MMHKIFFVLLLFLVLMLVGECYDMSGGESTSVVGPGSIGTSSSQPVYDYSRGSFSTGRPSNYVVPQINIRSTNSESDTSSGSNSNGTLTGSPQMAFAMTSDVAGTGAFAIRNYLAAKESDNKAYQLMSAKNGSLTHSSELSFYKDSQTSTDEDTNTLYYAIAKIAILDSISFVGKSYSDISRFENNEDFIQDVTRAGAISKGRLYHSQSLMANFTNVTDSKDVRNNYIVYDVSGRFVGSSNLHAITNNTEIMQSYIGEIAMNRNITSQVRYNRTSVMDPVLECCNPSLGSITSLI
jgi:hypothetical protein